MTSACQLNSVFSSALKTLSFLGKIPLELLRSAPFLSRISLTTGGSPISQMMIPGQDNSSLKLNLKFEIQLVNFMFTLNCYLKDHLFNLFQKGRHEHPIGRNKDYMQHFHYSWESKAKLKTAASWW